VSEIHPNITIDNASINLMILDVYKDINLELKKYTKSLILEIIGIKLDSWGRIVSISDNLKDKVLNFEEIQTLQDKLVDTIREEITIKLNNEMENKFYSKKAINQISSSIFTSLNKQVISQIETNIRNELMESFTEAVKTSVYSIPQIQELVLKKL